MNAALNFNKIKLNDTDRKIGTWLAYAHLFFLYVRPQEYIPGMGAIPTSGLLSLALIVWGVFHLRGFLIKTPMFIIFLLGLAYGLSAIDAVNVTAHRTAFKTIVEILPQCIAIYLLFDSKERVVKLLQAWCVIYFFVALITILNGGVGPGDFTRDENDAALALSIGFAFCLYGFWYPGFGKQFRYFALVTALLIAAGITITASRGGFLGLVAVLLMVWWFSKHRFKIAIFAVVGSLTLSGILFSVLPEGYLDEMQSINDTEDSTRVERFRLWETAWEMYKDNPFVGVGVGNQRYNMMEYSRKTSWYSGDGTNYQGKVAHSVYFQVISETGTFGGAIYFYIMFFLPLGLYRIRNSLESKEDDYLLLRLTIQALIIAMGAYVVSGAFISVAYYPHLSIWIVMYAVVKRLYLMETESAAEKEVLVEEITKQSKEGPKEKKFKWETAES